MIIVHAIILTIVKIAVLIAINSLSSTPVVAFIFQLRQHEIGD